MPKGLEPAELMLARRQNPLPDRRRFFTLPLGQLLVFHCRNLDVQINAVEQGPEMCDKYRSITGGVQWHSWKGRR